MKVHKRLWFKLVLVIMLALPALFVFRTKLPFYERFHLWFRHTVPYRLAAATLRNSDICPFSEAYAGLAERSRTMAAVDAVARHTRLKERDSEGLQLWDTPIGPMWFPSKSDLGGVLFALAQYQVTAYPGIPVRRGDIVIDGGGYVGDWTKWVLNAGAARVLIVEPSREQLVCIQRNLAEEIRQGRVTVCPKGLWDADGRVYFSHDPANPAADRVTEDTKGAGEWIDLTTIDKLVAEFKLDRVDVIKLDIEGAESRAIRGARETLNRFRPQLAIATEHTADMYQNNRNVIQAVKEVASFYRVKCGYCNMTLEHGVVPETLYFLP